MSGFGYNAEYYDAATGMINLRARQYEPMTMRFSQEDIIRGSVSDPISLNRYLYCHNNPLSFSDPTGMSIFSKLKSAAKSAVKAVKSTAKAAAAKAVSTVAKVTAKVANTVSKVSTAVAKVSSTVAKAATKIAANSNSKLVKSLANSVAKTANKVTQTANKVTSVAKKVEKVSTQVAKTYDKKAQDAWSDAKKNFSTAARDFNAAAEEAKGKAACVGEYTLSFAQNTLATNFASGYYTSTIVAGNTSRLMSRLISWFSSCNGSNESDEPKEGEPGYLYETVNEAAVAGALYIGPESFKTGNEYAVSIYAVEIVLESEVIVKQHQFLFFKWETTTSVPTETIEMYAFTNPSTLNQESNVTFPLASNRVATVHTHPFHASDSILLEYQDISSQDRETGDKKNLDMYVYRADGILLKYMHDSGDGITRINVPLDSDPHLAQHFGDCVPASKNIYPMEEVK